MRSCACVLYRRRAVTSRRTEDNLTPQFRIKNWKKHQHYKGRRPPWIKLHAALLDDYEFECLQDDSKMHLIAIWLLASRSRDCHPDGDPLLPEDEPYLTKKAGLKKKVSLTPLFSSGFLVRYQLDSNLIAERKQLVPTETETYKEETQNRAIAQFVLPNDVDKTLWQEFMQMRTKIRKPATDRAKWLLIGKLANLEKQGYDQRKVMQQSIRNCWQDVFPLREDRP